MTTTFLVENGDVVVSDASGQPTLVADNVKVRQDINGALATEFDSDDIGAGLEEIIGTLGDAFSLRADIAQRVRSSLARMQALQNQFQRAQRPRDERIAQLIRLDVFPLEGSFTSVSFRAEILTVAGTVVASSGTLQG